MTPAPLYPGIPGKFGNRSRVKVEVIKTDPSRNFVPTKEELEAAYENANNSGSKPRILFVVNPANPTGVSYSKETLEMMLDFAESK